MMSDVKQPIGVKDLAEVCTLERFKVFCPDEDHVQFSSDIDDSEREEYLALQKKVTTFSYQIKTIWTVQFFTNKPAILLQASGEPGYHCSIYLSGNFTTAEVLNHWVEIVGPITPLAIYVSYSNKVKALVNAYQKTLVINNGEVLVDVWTGLYGTVKHVPIGLNEGIDWV